MNMFKLSLIITMILITVACTESSTEKNTDSITTDAGQNPTDDTAGLENTTPVEPLDVIISFALQQTTTNLGDIVTAKIIQESHLITEGGGINLQYDPQAIEMQKVSVDTAVWSFDHRNGVIDNSSGVVSDIVFANYADVQGENVIATITMKVLTSDKIEIKMTESSLNPFASKGKKIRAGFESLFIN